MGFASRVILSRNHAVWKRAEDFLPDLPPPLLVSGRDAEFERRLPLAVADNAGAPKEPISQGRDRHAILPAEMPGKEDAEIVGYPKISSPLLKPEAWRKLAPGKTRGSRDKRSPAPAGASEVGRAGSGTLRSGNAQGNSNPVFPSGVKFPQPPGYLGTSSAPALYVPCVFLRPPHSSPSLAKFVPLRCPHRSL